MFLKGSLNRFYMKHQMVSSEGQTKERWTNQRWRMMMMMWLIVLLVMRIICIMVM